VPVITRLRERTDGPASPKKEKPSLAQFKQTHEPFARKQARRRAAAHAHAHAHAHAKGWLAPPAHAVLLSAQALPGISGADGVDSTDGATGATGATGGPKPARAGRGDYINISNTSRPKKARAPPAGGEMREMLEIDELLQEYGLE